MKIAPLDLIDLPFDMLMHFREMPHTDTCGCCEGNGVHGYVVDYPALELSVLRFRDCKTCDGTGRMIVQSMN